jgi:hypothetical protein
MFVSDRLVYLQMQKTASTHIAKALAAVVGGEQHLQHKRLVIDPHDRLVVASIRDPWSWYVSLWAYGCRGGGGAHGLYHLTTSRPPDLVEIGTRSIRYVRANRRWPGTVLSEARAERARLRSVRTDLWRSVYTSPDDITAFRGWLRFMFDPERAPELPGQPPRYGETGLAPHSGFMTFRYLTLLADDRARLAEPGAVDSLDALRQFDRVHTVHDDMIKIEDLEPELLRVLKRAGYELSDAQLATLAEHCRTKTNASEHLTTREYYDDVALELVGTREKFLIDKYGYEPPA